MGMWMGGRGAGGGSVLLVFFFGDFCVECGLFAVFLAFFSFGKCCPETHLSTPLGG
jgi:hypothetical protein